MQTPGFFALGAGYGTEVLPCSNSNTLMRDLAGLNKPSFSSEQAISHMRQLVHLSGYICSAFAISLRLLIVVSS